jgi:hypothetical protein
MKHIRVRNRKGLFFFPPCSNNAGYFAIDQEIENDIELPLHELGHYWLEAVD